MKTLTSMIFFNRVSIELADFVESIRLVEFTSLLESVEFELLGLFGGLDSGLCLAAEQVQGALEHGL